ncbi:MAG: hypothetical protein JRJ85_06010 [Deltaproteobacteria bacterium]|nr:hypothetical protein [Deltaproteobacteria bacterium]
MQGEIGAIKSQIQEDIRKVFVLIGAITLILLAVVQTVAYFVSKRVISNPISQIVHRLDESAEQVASASHRISGSSQLLSEGASEQAASIEETSSSLEEMSAMTKQNANNANEADNLMKDANTVVKNANASMSDLAASMNEISGASEETSKIIKTIDEIAFQTNLLALNAAVEAARAGEAGAGFAVVADEVRNLAMRAADAAKNTAGMIEATIKKVNDGSELMTRTDEAFTQVADKASKVGELVAEIAAASNEQAQGIEQLNMAIAEMDRVTQQNAATAEESASASVEMNTQSGALGDMVDDLMDMVGGNRATVNSEKRTEVGAEKPDDEKTVGEQAPNAPKAMEQKPDQVIPMDEEKDFADF